MLRESSLDPLRESCARCDLRLAEIRSQGRRSASNGRIRASAFGTSATKFCQYVCNMAKWLYAIARCRLIDQDDAGTAAEAVSTTAGAILFGALAHSNRNVKRIKELQSHEIFGRAAEALQAKPAAGISKKIKDTDTVKGGDDKVVLCTVCLTEMEAKKKGCLNCRMAIPAKGAYEAVRQVWAASTKRVLDGEELTKKLSSLGDPQPGAPTGPSSAPIPAESTSGAQQSASGGTSWGDGDEDKLLQGLPGQPTRPSGKSRNTNDPLGEAAGFITTMLPTPQAGLATMAALGLSDRAANKMFPEGF